MAAPPVGERVVPGTSSAGNLMQRRLVTWFAAVILIAHGLLGCCWHHRHVHASAEADPHHAAAHPYRGPAAVKTTSQPAARACCHHGHHQPPAKSPTVPDAERHALASTAGHQTQSPATPSPAEPSPDSPCTEGDCVFVAGSRGAEAVEQADCGPPADSTVDWARGPSCLQRVVLDVAGIPRDRDTWEIGRAHV